LESADVDTSPLRTRSSRKIVVKSGGAGPPVKTARRESVDGGQSGTERAQIDTSNEDATPLLDDSHWELKREEDEDFDALISHPTTNDRLSDESAKKLHALISAYSPELLKMRPQYAVNASNNDEGNTELRKRGAAERRARSTDTLEDLLYSSVSVQKLRDHLFKLQAPLITPAALRAHLSGSHIVPSRNALLNDKRKLTAINTIMSIVDEMARRGVVQRGDPSSSAQDAYRNYALSVRLPIGDYYTSAVTLTHSEALSLNTANARLIDIDTSHKGRLGASARDVPDIGSRLARGVDNRPLHRHAQASATYVPRREEDGEPAKTASHLYYDPWSSFAPAYDSFDGQLGYAASAALWRFKRDDHAAMLLRSRSKPSVHGLSARMSFRDSLTSLIQEEDGLQLDIDSMLAGFDSLPDKSLAGGNTDVESILRHNAQLLGHLHDLQEQRWQQLLAQYKLRKGQPMPALAEPDANERAIASYLYDSLVKTLDVRPHLDDSGDHAGLIPSGEVLRAMGSSSAIDPSLLDGKAEPGVWGTLDEHLFGPTASKRVTVSRSAPPVRPVAAIRDDETCRLPIEQEDKVATYLANSAQTSQAGRSREKGLLDAFASSRSYSIEDHPHDRKPPIPPHSTSTARLGVQQGESANTTLKSHPQPVQQAASPGRPLSREQSFNRMVSFGQARQGSNLPRHASGQTMSYARPPPSNSSVSRYPNANLPSWNANQQMASIRRQ
jgi:hypothetical protein